MNVSSFLLDMF